MADTDPFESPDRWLTVPASHWRVLRTLMDLAVESAKGEPKDDPVRPYVGDDGIDAKLDGRLYRLTVIGNTVHVKVLLDPPTTW